MDTEDVEDNENSEVSETSWHTIEPSVELLYINIESQLVHCLECEDLMDMLYLRDQIITDPFSMSDLRQLIDDKIDLYFYERRPI